MTVVELGWDAGEMIFAIAAMLVVAMSVFGVDKLFFRPRQKIRPPAPPRKHRVSYVIEETFIDEPKKRRR